MDHLAILDKKRKLLEKILSGEKTIESRWYKHRKTPYGNIKTGEKVYFKDSGEPVTAVAEVEKVLLYGGLNKQKVKKILADYGKQIAITNENIEKYSGKNYCTLIFLKNAKKINAFQINKKGYGLMTAWISVEAIGKIKKIAKKDHET